MIRTVVTPKKPNISINLPESFVGKKVEVIAFTLEEMLDQSVTTGKPHTHLASENVLSKDWLTPEEDKAWQDL